MRFFKKWLNTAIIFILTLSLLAPTTVNAETGGLVESVSTDLTEKIVSQNTYDVKVTIRDLENEIIGEFPKNVEQGATVYTVLKAVLEEQNIAHDIPTSSYGPYIQTIAGISGGSLGGWDGWMYTVNGEAPQVGIGDYGLKASDEVVVYYNKWPKLNATVPLTTSATSVTVTIDLEGDIFTEAAINLNNWTINVGNTELMAQSITLNGNQQAHITLNGQVKAGQVKIAALAEALSSNAASDEIEFTVEAQQPVIPELPSIPEASLSYVNISITSSFADNPLALTTIEILSGDTVFDVLKRATTLHGVPLSYRTTSYGVYIDGINGVFEFDRGPLSGWMYRVNGVFPSYSVSLYSVQPNDVIEFLYTTDLGKDIGGYVDEGSKGGTPLNGGEIPKTPVAPPIDKSVTETKPEEQQPIPKTDVRVEVPPTAIELAQGEELIAAVTKQKNNSFEVTLAITAKDGEITPLILGKQYATVTIPAVAPTTIALQVVNDEYRAIPHKIVNGELVLFVKAGGTFVLTEDVVSFADIVKLANKDKIGLLASRQVIKGKTVGTFAPNAAITRAQFAAMISRALGLQASRNTSFKDTTGKWYAADVQALYEAGITTGKTADTFDPEAFITRQQAAAMMARVLDYVNYEVTQVPELTFKDANKIPTVYKADIALLHSLAILSGKQDGTFDTVGTLTRAQGAKILERTLTTIGFM